MNTILVWVLVTVGGAHSSDVSYSPQVADLDSCVRMQKAADELREKLRLRGMSTKCVQITVVK
jgi:hypothetical protein